MKIDRLANNAAINFSIFFLISVFILISIFRTFLGGSYLIQASIYFCLSLVLILFISHSSPKSLHPRQSGQHVPVILAAMATGFWFFLTVNALDFASVLAPENAVSGLLRRDTLYHASIASMIAVYGIPSTGLDGLVLTPYHILSHGLLGFAAKGLNLDTVTGFFLGHQLVLVPLMVFALLSMTNALQRRAENGEYGYFNPLVPVFALILLSYFDFKSYLVSETQALGLILISTGAVFLKGIAEQGAGRITHGRALFGALLAMLMVAAKISTGFVFICGFGYLLVRTRRATLVQAAYLLALALALLFFAKFYLVPDSHAQQTQLNLFHFFIAYKTVAWANLVLICLGAAACGANWFGGRLRPLHEALLVIMVVSLLPALVLQIDGGSAYYFLNTGAWIAIGVCSAYVIEQTRQINGIVWTSSLALIALLTIEAVKSQTVEVFTSKIDRLQSALYGSTLPKVVNPFDFGALERIGTRVADLPLSRLAVTLNGDGRPERDALVFISAELFKASPYMCIDAPFFVPAFVGMPMLMAVPTVETNCKTGPHYSFPNYKLPQVFKGPTTDLLLCDAAMLRNFERVIVVESVDIARVVSCLGKS